MVRQLLALGVALSLLSGCGGSGSTASAPHPGISKVADAGPARAKLAQLPVDTRLQVTFGTQTPQSTGFLLDGHPLAPGDVHWDPDQVHAILVLHLRNGGSDQLALAPGSRDAAGRAMPDWKQDLKARYELPANNLHPVDANFLPHPPWLVQVENSNPSRPQAGIQAADIAYEYVSEFEISRFTLVYLNQPPPTVGPVRSMRLISIPLAQAYNGLLLCSGASDHVLGEAYQAHPAMVIEDHDRAAGYFYREGSRDAPHNLFIRDSELARAMSERGPKSPVDYWPAPQHPDLGPLPGAAASAAPEVGVHSVRYEYDPEHREYRRFDHGAPFGDAATGAPLRVKTIIQQHVPVEITPFLEDASPSIEAHSVRYGIVGDGPADIWMEGQHLAGRWHQEPNQPPHFLASDGSPLYFDTGLTWIHVLA